MKKVIVLGGSGFIGTALCRQLVSASVPFKIVDLKPSRNFPEKSTIADIRDSDAMRAHLDGDVIVNLAAVHRDDVRDRKAYYETNVEGTRVVTEIAEEKGIDRIVFTSSVAVYGFAPVGTGETGVANPFNDYGKSKFEGEKILRAWRDRKPGSRGLIVVRPTVVFGEGNRGNVYNLLNQIASGRFLMIGNGRNRKSMAYVENVAAFILAAALSPRNQGLFNYVDTPDLDMNELVSLVRRTLFGKPGVGMRLPYGLGLIAGYMADAAARTMGRSFPISSIRVRKFCADSAFTSAKDELDGFVPHYTLREGLLRTLEAEFISPDPGREVFFTE